MLTRTANNCYNQKFWSCCFFHWRPAYWETNAKKWDQIFSMESYFSSQYPARRQRGDCEKRSSSKICSNNHILQFRLVVIVFVDFFKNSGLNKDCLKEASRKFVVTENLSVQSVESDTFIDLLILCNPYVDTLLVKVNALRYFVHNQIWIPRPKIKELFLSVPFINLTYNLNWL